MPNDASLSSHKLQHADVLVFATDGVWDNLSSQEVLDQVSASMIRREAWANQGQQGIRVGKNLAQLTKPRSGTDKGGGCRSLQAQLAVDITSKAKAASINTKRDGPFARAVQEAFPDERFAGGKVDDICVVVAIALDTKEP